MQEAKKKTLSFTKSTFSGQNSDAKSNHSFRDQVSSPLGSVVKEHSLNQSHKKSYLKPHIPSKFNPKRARPIERLEIPHGPSIAIDRFSYTSQNNSTPKNNSTLSVGEAFAGGFDTISNKTKKSNQSSCHLSVKKIDSLVSITKVDPQQTEINSPLVADRSILKIR